MGFGAGHRFICICAAKDWYYEARLLCKAKKVPSLKGVVECCNAFEVVTAESRATNPYALKLQLWQSTNCATSLQNHDDGERNCRRVHVM